MVAKILFIEPPKDYWFLMGEHLPPPTALLVLAAYVERELPEVEVEVMDCQGEQKGWEDVEARIASSAPSLVAASGFTANAYACARVAETAKKVDKDIATVMGGQHFSAVPEESLRDFPEIDYLVRGEGEQTLVELVRALREGKDVGGVKGLAFRHDGGIVQTPPRPLLENLDTLPYPAYHLVEQNIDAYHFSVMAGRNTRYMILEGSRGCQHRCTFCTQWRHWNGTWRSKSPKRIADEMAFLNERFGAQFLWLTDDNFNYRARADAMYEALRQHDLGEDVTWFFQARTDDIAGNPGLVAKLRAVGNTWILMGVESDSPETLRGFRKGTRADDASRAVKVLDDLDVFSQCMYVIGSRKDTAESIERLREFSLDLDPKLSIYGILTPMPGTEVHAEAARNGWIEDANYAHYDMIHAIMPTETLARQQVQEELYRCYRAFYGSIVRGIAGVFSSNRIERRAYRHMAKKRLLRKLRRLL